MCATIRIMRDACMYLFWQVKLYQFTLVTIRPFTHPPLLPAIIITKYFELLANTSLICMHTVTPGLEHNTQMGHTCIEHANFLQLRCVATYVVTYLSVAVCLLILFTHMSIRYRFETLRYDAPLPLPNLI